MEMKSGVFWDVSLIILTLGLDNDTIFLAKDFVYIPLYSI